MERRSVAFDELVLAIGHVEQSHVHQCHLDQLAFNVGSQLSLIAVGLVLNQIHQT